MNGNHDMVQITVDIILHVNSIYM